VENGNAQISMISFSCDCITSENNISTYEGTNMGNHLHCPSSIVDLGSEGQIPRFHFAIVFPDLCILSLNAPFKIHLKTGGEIDWLLYISYSKHTVHTS
jgi:hypothetical protein